MIASQLIFDSGVPLVLLPCMGVCSHLTTTKPELETEIKGKSRIGTYLTDIVVNQLGQEASIAMLNGYRYSYLRGQDDYDNKLVKDLITTDIAPSRIIWDISTIGYMVNPIWCPSTLVPAPHLLPEIKWKSDPSRHLMRICNFIYRDAVFGDMFAKLKGAV